MVNEEILISKTKNENSFVFHNYIRYIPILKKFRFDMF